MNETILIEVNSPDSLSEYDLKDVNGSGATHAWYHYETGSFEGWGYLLGLMANKTWFVHDMGHCSCYGPTERIHEASGYDTLAQIEEKNSHNAEVWAKILPLIEAAKTAGFR